MTEIVFNKVRSLEWNEDFPEKILLSKYCLEFESAVLTLLQKFFRRKFQGFRHSLEKERN